MILHQLFQSSPLLNGRNSYRALLLAVPGSRGNYVEKKERREENKIIHSTCKHSTHTKNTAHKKLLRREIHFRESHDFSAFDETGHRLIISTR